MARNVIRIRDRGARRLLRTMRRQRDIEAKVGVIGEKADEPHGSAADSTETNGFIAALNELGIGVPERSFVRATIDDHTDRYRRLFRANFKQVINGIRTPLDLVGLVALKAESDMKAKIRGRIPPPNAPATIARKESDVPLIDEGQLIQSISHATRVK